MVKYTHILNKTRLWEAFRAIAATLSGLLLGVSVTLELQHQQAMLLRPPAPTSQSRILARRKARLSQRTRQILTAKQSSQQSPTTIRGPVISARMPVSVSLTKGVLQHSKSSSTNAVIKRLTKTSKPIAMNDSTTDATFLSADPSAIVDASNLRPAAPSEPTGAPTPAASPTTSVPVPAPTPIVAPTSSSLPPLGRTVHPFDKVPNWGNMHSAAVWERTYAQMIDADFVPVPAYDLSILTRPLLDFTKPITIETIPSITMKLYYSTIYCAPYTINPTGEYTGDHCAVDLKVADGTPVRAIGGGRVAAVSTNADFGIYMMIEHALPEGGRVVSVYAHLSSVAVASGQDVVSGQIIGEIGMTGKTSGPHLHLQVDRLHDNALAADHVPHVFDHAPSAAEADWDMMHPIRFIERYGKGS